MLKRHTALAAALTAGLMILSLPLPAAAAEAPIAGTLVADTAHELPAPATALASDGRALVVWQDAIPGDDSGVCTQNGGACSIIGSIIDADGEAVGEPFVISGAITNNYYFSAPSVTWNEDLNEWLVLFTTYTPSPLGVYAQRVSDTGALVGEQVMVPTTKTLLLADRGTAESPFDLAPSDLVKASATWSSADEAYLISWLGSHASTGQVPADRSVFGYFATGALDPVDGVEANFIVSDSTVVFTNARVGYSDALDQFMVLWTTDNNDQVKARSLELMAPAITAGAVRELLPPTSGIYFDSRPAGGVTWVASREAWLFSWGAQLTGGDDWATFGRELVGGTLGPIVTLSAFGELTGGRSVLGLYGQELQYDEATDTIQAVATGSAVGNRDQHFVLHWTLDPATLAPSAPVEFRQPDETAQSPAASRIQLSVLDGGVAVVYQNWPLGSYRDPAQVRYALLSPVAITPPTPPVTEPTPTITLNAAELPAGGQLTVAGTGFTPNSPVVVSLGSTVLATVTANADGAIAVTVTIPPGTPPGLQEVRAVDTASALVAVAAVTIVPTLAATGVAETLPLGIGAALLVALGMLLFTRARGLGIRS